MPYIQVDIHLYFGGTYCPHLQGERASKERTNRRKEKRSAGLEKLYFQERR
jgi:hypothetical protein